MLLLRKLSTKLTRTKFSRSFHNKSKTFLGNQSTHKINVTQYWNTNNFFASAFNYFITKYRNSYVAIIES